MKFSQRKIKDLVLRPVLAAAIGLFIGGLFTLLTGNSPLEALRVLLTAGFGCGEFSQRCALLTTFQYATPLFLSGLSAAVAFRAGFFSIGQFGQMLLGAAAANWIANLSGISPILHPLLALILAAVFGMGYALLPTLLKVFLGINEIITTILFNSTAFYLVGLIPSGYGRWIPQSARLSILAPGTKLNTGLVIALALCVVVYFLLWRSAAGYEIRMAGQNKAFALQGGIQPARRLFYAMMVSGALAGLAGGGEVLGVHYHFVQNFTGSDTFDGVMVALIGFCHPLGILFSSFLLSGVRLAAMTGLSIQMGIPRAIGGMMISVMVIVMGSDHIYTLLKTSVGKAIGRIRRLVSKEKPGL